MTTKPPVTLNPGDDMIVRSTVTPKLSWTDASHTGLRIVNPAPVEPPPPPPVSGVYGPAINADAKGNQRIGGPTDLHQAIRWTSEGGEMTGFAYDQRTGPDSGTGSGYAMGDGGRINVTVHSGSPTGPILGQLEFQVNNPHRVDGESFAFIPLKATIPPGLTFLVFDNISPDRTRNWSSLNYLWHPGAKPRQPAFPDDVLAAMHRTGNEAWTVYEENTPVFDIRFADGHHEGQAYYGVITGKEVLVSGATQVRARFTTDREISFKDVWFRVQRVSGTGDLSVHVQGTRISNGAIGTAPIASIPASSTSSLTGGKWVRVSVGAPTVVLPANGEYTVTFSTPTGTVIKVMPIREVAASAGWGSRAFREGVAEKTTGGGWTSVYPESDLQWYVA